MQNIYAIPKIKSVRLRVFEYTCSCITGYKTVGVNPSFFLSAEPRVTSFPMENPDPRTPPARRFVKKEFVRMRFGSGTIWEEYNVEPDEAYRVLGYDVKDEI